MKKIWQFFFGGIPCNKCSLKFLRVKDKDIFCILLDKDMDVCPSPFKNWLIKRLLK